MIYSVHVIDNHKTQALELSDLLSLNHNCGTSTAIIIYLGHHNPCLATLQTLFDSQLRLGLIITIDIPITLLL